MPPETGKLVDVTTALLIEYIPFKAAGEALYKKISSTDAGANLLPPESSFCHVKINLHVVPAKEDGKNKFTCW